MEFCNTNLGNKLPLYERPQVLEVGHAHVTDLFQTIKEVPHFLKAKNKTFRQPSTWWNQPALLIFTVELETSTEWGQVSGGEH